MRSVDINCDLGEGQSLVDCAQDALLMPYLSRCNIACGGHAGNSLTMQKTLHNAKHHGVLCGAHPGYPDKANFGRSVLPIASARLLDSLLKQITNLYEQASDLKINLSHVKLHGALYNEAEKLPQLAMDICQMLACNFPKLAVLGLPHGAMQAAAKQHGLAFLREGFMDRAYLANGFLAPRTEKESVYQSNEPCISQVLSMLNRGEVMTLDNQRLPLEVDSICLHGDSPIALALASQLISQLAQHHWIISNNA